MFIKLTYPNGQIFFLNIDRMISFSKGGNDKFTTIGVTLVFNGTPNRFLVKETPDQIKKLIDEANNEK